MFCRTVMWLPLMIPKSLLLGSTKATSRQILVLLKSCPQIPFVQSFGSKNCSYLQRKMQNLNTCTSLHSNLQLRLGDFHAALECYTKAADLAPGISGICISAQAYCSWLLKQENYCQVAVQMIWLSVAHTPQCTQIACLRHQDIKKNTSMAAVQRFTGVACVQVIGFGRLSWCFRMGKQTRVTEWCEVL